MPLFLIVRLFSSYNPKKKSVGGEKMKKPEQIIKDGPVIKSRKAVCLNEPFETRITKPKTILKKN